MQRELIENVTKDDNAQEIPCSKQVEKLKSEPRLTQVEVVGGGSVHMALQSNGG